jgi:tetratricopeptide (TPR) repeat protein
VTFPSLLMEDHCHAYSFWKEHGFKDGICVHVDAHLDLMDRGFTPKMLEKIATVRSAEDLKQCLTPTFLPWGGVHCGNYLYPALLEGVVTHLIWVVPKKMVADAGSLLDFSHEELLNWMELTLEEHDSLRQDGPRVEGVLAGQRFTLCTSEHLPELDDRPVLLDIDVDYFQDSDDKIWQTPGELHREMGLERIDVLTTAVSVDGGYTCLEHRYLGEVIEQVFAEGPDSPWEARTIELLAADEKRKEEPEVYDGLGSEADPAWFAATLALKKNLAQGLSVQEACEPAAALDSRYRALDMNEALCRLRAGLVDEALALTGDSQESLFVRAVIAFQGGRFDVSKQSWDAFLAGTELTPEERAFALFIRGQAVVQTSSPEEALADLSEASKLDPNNYQYALFCGLVLQLTGDLKKAAKVWRKALNKHGDRLASIGLHLELSRLYRVMGRAALANAELRRVAQKDTSGEYKMVIQLEHLRSKKLTLEIPEPCLTGVFTGSIGVGGLR